MKKLLLAASIFALSARTVLGADLAPQAAEPVAPAYGPYDWTGFYAGISGGYDFGTGHDVTMGELFPGNTPLVDRYGRLSPKGGFGGVQGGYNWQSGNFVVGLEADIQAADISDRTSGVGAVTNYSVSTKSQATWFGTVRPRIGYAFDNILIYATGGLVFGGVKYSQDYADLTNAGFFARIRDDKTRLGYAVGAGAEYAFNQHWTAKLEYQYIDLGRSTISGEEFLDGNPTDFTIQTRLHSDFHTIRAGVSYKF